LKGTRADVALKQTSLEAKELQEMILRGIFRPHTNCGKKEKAPDSKKKGGIPDVLIKQWGGPLLQTDKNLDDIMTSKEGALITAWNGELA